SIKIARKVKRIRPAVFIILVNVILSGNKA
ncbi:MAG: hypothetical protein ACI8X3_003259, partial [Saprospiraceae bacterium]